MHLVRGTVGLTLLAGTAAFVLIPAAYAGRSSGDKVSRPVKAAAEEAVGLLHNQSLAVVRNTHYLEERTRFRQMLVRLAERTPATPHEAAVIAYKTRIDQHLLAHINRNIDLSRQHLLSALPGAVARVESLLDQIARLAPNNPRVGKFLLFALARQQKVLDQLRNILNQEDASIILPGPR